MNRIKNGILFCAGALSLFSLAACNEAGSTQAQNVGEDWVQDSTSAPTPAPSPAPAPNPTPTSTPAPTSQVYTGPAEVASYVQKFIDDAAAQGRNVLPAMANPKLEIKIASLSAYGSSTIGLCESGGSLRRVTFDPTFWNSASATQRELLAHHELGHCVLLRAHRSDVLSTGAYASIMYPIILASSTYTANYAYYQQELYNSEALETAGINDDPNATTVHICNGLDELN